MVFASGRTKTAVIVKCALVSALNAEVVEECQSSPFTLLCDGGNDQMGKKYFGIMVRYWSEMAHQPVMRLRSNACLQWRYGRSTVWCDSTGVGVP